MWHNHDKYTLIATIKTRIAAMCNVNIINGEYQNSSKYTLITIIISEVHIAWSYPILCLKYINCYHKIENFSSVAMPRL